MTNLADLSTRAWQHYQQGQASQAEAVCWQILRQEPLRPDAIYLLGVLALDGKQPVRALLYFHHASLLQPGNANFQQAQAAAYRALGRTTDAVGCLREALRLAPHYAEAHNALGSLLLDTGDLTAAAASFRQAIAFQPGYEKAHLNLGLVLHTQGELDGASVCFEEAIRLRPGYALAQNNLGAVRQSQGRLKEAETHFREALRLQPDYASAHFNLGITLLSRGDAGAATVCLREAVRLQPDYARAHHFLGRALASQGLGQAAHSSYQTALRLKPDLAEAHHDLGLLLLEQCHRELARDAFQKALSCKPDFPEAFVSLVGVRAWLCDWSQLDDDLQRLAQDADRALAAGRATAVTPFQALMTPWPPARHLAIARNYANSIKRDVEGLRERFQHSHRRTQPGRLRVGYLSADFHAHATLHLMQGLFGLHDRQQFQIFAYSYGPDDNSVYRQRVSRDVEHFREVARLPSLSIAEQIHADGIQILVDLKGYTGSSRPGILALRPAPVQVSYLGYPGTLGADFIDYLLGDSWVTPLESAAGFQEQLVLLPHSYQVNDHQQPIAEPISRRDAGLPEGKFVFCCFNNSYKIEPGIFNVWMRILAQVPNSVLWLLSCGPTMEGNLAKEAAARGIARERLIFARHLPKPDHLARLRHADLFLDTFLCNAHTTGSDALWAGVPVLTCPGSSFASRVGASLLHAAGLPELVVADLHKYESLAVSLAHHSHELQQYRQKLAEVRTSCPLFDTPRFARNLERAYLAMWDIYRTGQAPRAIVVTEA